MVLRLALSVISLVVTPLSPKRAHNRGKVNVFFLNRVYKFKKNLSTLKIIPQTSRFVNSSCPIGGSHPTSARSHLCRFVIMLRPPRDYDGDMVPGKHPFVENCNLYVIFVD